MISIFDQFSVNQLSDISSDSYIIGLDPATTQVGVVVLKNGNVHESAVCDYPTCEQILRKYQDKNPTVVCEWFTKTMRYNDRANSFGRIRKNIKTLEWLVDEILNLKFAKAVTFSWRKVFNLPTLVELDVEHLHPNVQQKWRRVAKILGHDILKKHSVDFVKNNYEQEFSVFENTNLEKVDDLVEAFLIAKSFEQTNRFYNDDAFYNVLNVDVHMLFNQLTDFDNANELLEV